MKDDKMSKARFVQDNVMETARYFTDNLNKICWVMDYCREYGDSASKGAVAYLEDVWDILTEAGYGESPTSTVTSTASGDDYESFKQRLLEDPKFLSSVVEQGKRASVGIRR